MLFVKPENLGKRLMRKNKSETAESRRRILTVAARLIRERGAEKVSVGEVMSAAGMTHGGFYSHFDSKEALLAAAADEAFAEKLDYLGALDRAARSDALLGYIDGYMSLGHVAGLGTGCPIAGLGGDAAHADPAFRQSMADGARQTLDTFVTNLPFANGDSRAEAIRVLTSMVGAIVVARTLGDANLQKEVIDTVRTSGPLSTLLGRKKARKKAFPPSS